MSQIFTLAADESLETHNAGAGLRDRFFATTTSGQVLHGNRNEVSEADNDVMADAMVDRPTIRFHPSWEDHQARTRMLEERRAGAPAPELPEGFPPAIEGRRAWSAQSIQDISELMEVLSGVEVEELEAAVDHFKSKDFSSPVV